MYHIQKTDRSDRMQDTAPNNNGAGHTFADTNGNQITIFRNTWRDFRPHQLNTPVFVVETNDILESIDGMQSYATTILHEVRSYLCLSQMTLRIHIIC